MKLPDLRELGALARMCAQDEIMPRFADVGRHLKTDGSVVTEADHAMQDRMQRELAAHFSSKRNYISSSGQLNAGPTPIDPDMELQYQDEMSVGGEIQLGRSWVAGARYINRQIGNVIEDHHVVDAAGKRVDYIVSNIGSGLYASEFHEPERKYPSVELTLQRRMTDRWQLASSFVWAEEEGDYNGLYSNATNFDGGGSPNATYDIEMPEWQRNAYGKLRGDVPWQFKLHGSYSFPFGLTVSEGLIYSAGVTISGMLMGYPLGGIRVEPRLVPRLQRQRQRARLVAAIRPTAPGWAHK